MTTQPLSMPFHQVDGASHKKTSDMAQNKTVHTDQAQNTWIKIQQLRDGGKVLLDGSELDIASVIAVARYNCHAYINMRESLVQGMDGSVKLLDEYLCKGYSVYGVNTGFGGSADSRTEDFSSLQSALLQHQQAGILTEVDQMLTAPNQDIGFHSMPVTWVRATMLVRCNHALRGHSGVRLNLIEAILQLLRKGITPVVPLRGSISASGDLMPLSYIAGVLEGNSDILVCITDGQNIQVVTAQEALPRASLEPFNLGPKEGLALINGTAASTAVGCLAAHDSNQLVLLAQMLVAMSCEALIGNAESYHPFIAAVQPHPGQVECASNILRFLRGSSLAQMLGQDNKYKTGLVQDRYSLRGTPQWLGPQLEELSTILSQLTTELNSTSDNPVINTEAGAVYSGANFIAASISSAMEKNRLSLQMIGKLLFSLSSELINPTLNKGLPPNLVVDDPSLSFTMKGIDISMAAYMSELAYVTNPVTSHIQSAEMHNQSINSLALISARYTMQATELVALMCAAHLYVVCQALDLRVLHITYLHKLKEGLRLIIQDLFQGVPAEHQDAFEHELYKTISDSWNASTRLDLNERCLSLADVSLPVLMNHSRKLRSVLATDALDSFRESIRKLAQSTFIATREKFVLKQNTSLFLGSASKRLYSFIRNELGVPLHQGLSDHPGQKPGPSISGRSRKTIGSWVSIIYTAIRDGRIWGPMVDILQAKASAQP
ncbi:Phenylalanine/tyrosine ammonia-lyase [Fusarium oxysporum]|nr:phenylalanine ammonia-lyase [Fusarium oxysporum f. sp. lycopersici MN25]RKL15369.1 Phenylalanine/tyrosine ammonia-lyase [Fusarium oxysporum]